MGLLCESVFAPPYYPADLVERIFRNSISGAKLVEQIPRIKIEEYRSKHGGKYPARIFITVGMLAELSNHLKCGVTENGMAESRLFGIPMSLIEGAGAQIYLSDEEA